ncbi:hypothetical protein ABPG74_005587 [Tetrahymena malaccensis]
MYQEEESIYNIIPKEVYIPPKQEKYKSRYPPNIIPTGSTLALRNSQKPNVRNCGGHFEEIIEDHPISCKYSTLGKPKGSYKQSPDRYLKKGEGSQSIFHLPRLQNNSSIRHSHSQEKIKPPVPKLSESPLLLQGTKKNFILDNIVSNILSVPAVSLSQPDWLKKKEYGQTPRYLQKIKERTLQESIIMKDIVRAQEQEEQKKLYELSQQELQNLREGLKSKWEQVYREYQQLTHITKIDTIHKLRKKEKCEEQLKQLEADMLKLKKNHIFVDATK